MICLVTDRRRVSAGSDAAERLVDLVASAARAGADLIQIRERDLEGRPLLGLVRRCLEVTEGTGAKVVVNDRTDVALAARAHGVHLRGDSISAAKVRTLLPDGAIIGRSVHTVQEAAAAAREGAADYLIFGTLFETVSKSPSHHLATLDDLTDVCRAAAGLPVLAIGGMNVERAALVRRAGASGVAGIGVFIPTAGHDREGYVQSIVVPLRRTFDTCKAVS
jgi:thiamine-phosphate diphosphorylase